MDSRELWHEINGRESTRQFELEHILNLLWVLNKTVLLVISLIGFEINKNLFRCRNKFAISVKNTIEPFFIIFYTLLLFKIQVCFGKLYVKALGDNIVYIRDFVKHFWAP